MSIQRSNEADFDQEIPVEEIEAAEKDDAKIVNLFHYAKDPSRSHGVPCKFVVYEKERFEETKKRIQLRIGAADKDFSRFKFSLVTATVFKQPSTVEDGKSLPLVIACVHVADSMCR